MTIVNQHAERLKMLIAQFAADPALLCGDVDIMLPGEYARLAQINATQVEIPETTLSALVAEQAAKTPDAPALVDARYRLPAIGNARTGGGAGESAA